ncbi:MAG: DUF3883 domain-containing protein [Methanomassiliicoccales archaeon]|nr:MAG: DUF3883 domain-containing protein [Methanomassiliicoccales archaeon]
MNWDHKPIRRKREQREREKELAPELAGDLNSLLQVFGELYGEKIHYALELIQNADDAEAKSVRFIFEPRRLIVTNDGNPFSLTDLDAIMRVAVRHKRSKIGFFGIGFKSVFNITDEPQIISGHYNFTLRDFIYPEEASDLPVNPKLYSSTKGAIFILPYSSKHGATFEELSQGTVELRDMVLLFLPSIQSIQVIVSGYDSQNVEMTKVKEDGGFTRLSTAIGGTTSESSWRVFTESFDIPKEARPLEKRDIERTEVVIAFRSPEEVRPEDLKREYVYCYLPTRKPSGLPFVVQADFLPTVGRGDLRDHEWNQLLLEKLGNLAANSILELRDDPSFAPFLFDLVPLLDDLTDKHMRMLVKSMHRKLSQMPIVRTLDSEWTTPTKCAVGDDHTVSVITKADLRFLFRRPLLFADPMLPQRAKLVIPELGGRSIGLPEVVRVVTRPTRIRNRSPRWFIHMYDYLSSEFSEKRISAAKIQGDQEFLDFLEELGSAQLLLLHPKGLASASDVEKGRLICYPQRTVKIEEVSKLFKDGRIAFLHRDLQNAKILGRKAKDEELERTKKRIKPFLEAHFNVQIYFTAFHVINRVILRLFESGEFKKYRHVDLYDFLDYIRRNLTGYRQKLRKDRPSIREEDIFKEIKEGIKIRCHKVRNGKRVHAYESPSDVYFTQRYVKTCVMETLFGDIEGACFLSPYYNSPESSEARRRSSRTRKKVPSWREFFQLTGVWSAPRVSVDKESVRITDWSKYKWVGREYSTKGHYVRGNVTAPDIRALIKSFGSMEPTEALKRAEILWLSLNRNWSSYRRFLGCDYEYHYRSWREKRVETSFIRMLKRSRWVLTASGRLARPNEVFRRTDQNELILGSSVSYAHNMGTNAFLRDIGVRLSPEPQEVIRHLKLLRKASELAGQNLIQNCSAAYSYLASKVEKEGNETLSSHLRSEFRKMKLIYVPREDKQWWGTDEVFWHDHRQVFMRRRECLENHYPMLKEFFTTLGAKENPEMADCLVMLKKLSMAKPRGERAILERKEIIARLYKHMEGILKARIEQDSNVLEGLRKSPVFLTENNEFKSPADIYFVDAERYVEIFDDLSDTLWLPYSWSSISRFLRETRIFPISDFVATRRYIRGISEVDADSKERLLEILSFVFPYLLKTLPDLYDLCPRDEVERLLNSLEILVAKSITVVFNFEPPGDSEALVRKITPSVYFDERENALYVRVEEDIFTLSVAREVSYLFEPAHDPAFTFLDSLMDSAHDYHSLQKRIKAHGLQDVASRWELGEEAPYLRPPEEGVEEPFTEEELPEDEETDDEGASRRKTPRKAKVKELIDLGRINEFIVHEVLSTGEAEETPQKKITAIKLPKRGKRGYIPEPPKGPLSPRELTSWMAERLAYMYEKHEKRKPKHVPRQDQDALGCDIISPPRYIEVKGFVGEGSSFEMRPSQLKKAQDEKDNFFLYVITNLEKGRETAIYIIQNPVENPHFIYEVKGGYRVSKWERSVCQKIEVKGSSARE